MYFLFNYYKKYVDYFNNTEGISSSALKTIKELSWIYVRRGE